jgi:hypothetical protein
MANDFLSDGYVQLCIDTSYNAFAGKCRVLVEGQMTTGSATPDVLRPVPTNRGIDTLFGSGSVLSESLKKLFCQCPSSVEVFVIPRTDPVGSVAAEYTLTFTGPATSDGRIQIFFLDRDYSVDVYVPSGATAAIIAAAVTAAIPTNFPYTLTQVAGVVTAVAKNKGDVGNYLKPVYNWQGRVGYAPTGVAMVTAHTVVGTGTYAPLNYANVLGDCCYSCFAILDGSAAAKVAWNAYLKTLWACDKPMCFGHGYSYSAGTLGQILATAGNYETMSILAHSSADDVGVPWLKTIAYAAKSCCSSCSNPELSIQGRTNGLLSCLHVPASCSAEFTYDEQVQLRAAGFVVTTPLDGGSGIYTSPYTTNDVTNSLYDDLGRPNATFRDVNSRRLAANTGASLAAKLSEFAGLGLFTKNTTIKRGTFGTNPRLMLGDIRAWAKSKVGVLFSEFENIDTDITLASDLTVAAACQGDPAVLHLAVKYRPPTRVGTIKTTLIPALLTNC